MATIHPSRSVHFEVPENTVTAKPKSQEKKKKTEAQKRYLAKKARKHRKLVKARKASAPKNKKWDSQDADGSNTEDGDTTRDTDDGDAVFGVNAEAGPSRSPSPVPEIEFTNASPGQNKKKEVKDKKEKRAKRDVVPTEQPIQEAGDAEEVEEAARLERKRLKREKRANRDKTERRTKKRAKLEQSEVSERDRPNEAGDTGLERPADAVEEDDKEEDEGLEDPQADGILQEGVQVDIDREMSSPTLEAFPIASAPPAADQALLSKQGLPKGLQKAQLIDPNLTSPLDDLPRGMQTTLRNIGIERLFAVQSALLPRFMSLPLIPTPYTRLEDYLASAPTGSGKTLAYVLPIVHILSSRVVTRLRALVVLPTKDLVVQVRETFESLTKGSGLSIGSITGQHSFAHEQGVLQGSKLDILVATPGRLIDHLKATPEFTLEHLRFLIIDEADRLLGQSYHNWLSQVLSATGASCQKLLFSATLTRDPAAIASLNLRNPQYLIVQPTSSTSTSTYDKFALPEQLTEKYLVTLPIIKPLVLIHLLEQCGTGGLVFTKSVEAVSRLAHLLTFYGGKVVKGYTSEMKPSERKRLLADFSDGKIDFLICSDLIARGMDLPTVAFVISYDTPMDMRKYVHRVGRTARAGRPGTAWTVVEKQEAIHFKAMIKEAGRDSLVKKMRVREEDIQPYREGYENAMTRLKALYGASDL